MLFGLGVMTLGLSTACQRSTPLRPTVEGPLLTGEGLKLGVLVSVVNLRRTDESEAVLNAAYLLRDRVNSCGGVNRAPVTTIAVEAGGTVRAEIEAMRKLIEEEQVHGAIATFISEDPTEAVELAIDARDPVLLASSGSLALSNLSLSEESTPYWGRTAPSQQQSINALAQVIINQGYTRVALVGLEEPPFQDWMVAFHQSFEAYGGVVENADNPLIWRLARDEQSDAQTDDSAVSPDGNAEFEAEAEAEAEATAERNQLENQLETLLQQENIAILVALDEAAGTDFLTLLTTLEPDGATESIFWPVFWMNPSNVQTSLNEALGDEGDRASLSGITGVTPTAVGEGFQMFKTEWSDRFGEPPSAKASYAWDAAALLALAAQMVGSDRPPAPDGQDGQDPKPPSDEDGQPPINRSIGSSETIASRLRTVANPPGVEVTDVCEGLKRLRAGEVINYEGASGPIDIAPSGEIAGSFDIWRINDEGQVKVVDRLLLNASVGEVIRSGQR